MIKKLTGTLAICMLAISSAAAQSLIERETFVYDVKEGQELHLDKYVDNSVEYAGKRPVMIYVHGGGFSMGSRINALQIKYNKHLASRGFVSISIDYRKEIEAGAEADQPTVLRAISHAPEDLIDTTANIPTKADQWNIDAEKIMISGGAQELSLVCTRSMKSVPKGNWRKHCPKDLTTQEWFSRPDALLFHTTL